MKNRSAGNGAANRTAKTYKTLTVNVCAPSYGALCEAGVLHGGIGPDKMLEVLLNKSNVIVNWANNDFPTDLNRKSEAL